MTEQFETVTVESRDARTAARFVPEANMLCCSLTHEGAEMLELRDGVEAYAQQGKTMGIPLLHPWANRLAGHGYRAAGKEVSLREGDPRLPVDPQGLPIHGVLPGLLRWEIEHASEHTIRARLGWDSPELLEVFPFEHELHVEAEVGEGVLTLATTLRATGTDAVPVSFGYHPYLRIPGGDRDACRIRLGVSRRMVLDATMIPTGQREDASPAPVELKGKSWDDGYDALPAPAEFEVANGGRGVLLTFLEGYPFAQVYGPEGEQFVCFEPMTAPTNALNSGDGLSLVRPGGEHRGAFSVTARDS